jgi:tetratricopeptide (TPR) repeat protein
MPHELRYREGDKIGGRYLVHKALAGGMGEVYLCLDLHETMPLALKTFQARYLASRKARELFEREAATWVALEKHPNIVRCFYMEKLDNIPFLLLEWVAGGEGPGADLRDLLSRGGPFEPRRALEFTLDVCRALEHAQKKVPGFVHCDIKPENILVAQGQLAKLTDFGLAKVVREARLAQIDELAPAAGGRWQVSSAGGTPPYMAPEQWLGQPVDARTDVYAVGCLLYELLTGRWPFRATMVEELKRQHLDSPPPPLGMIDIGSPREALDRLLARCLAKEQGNRYTSASELMGAIAWLFEAWNWEPPRWVPEAEVFTAADYSNRAATFASLGRHAEALEDHDSAIRLDPKLVQARYNRGNTYYLLGRYAEALEDHAAAIRLDPNCALAYFNRGTTYLALAQHAEALADFDAAIRLDPKLAAAHSYRGSTYVALGRNAGALADFDKALCLDPNLAHARAGRGNSLNALGRHSEAIVDYEAVIQLEPNLTTGYLGRGSAYHALSRHAQALADYEAAIRLDPKLARAYARRGDTFADLGRDAEALADYDEAIRIDPGDAQAHYNRGNIYASVGSYAQALAEYDAAIWFDPSLSQAYYNRGTTRAGLGRHTEALADYDAAIRLDPNLAQGYSNRGNSYQALGRHVDAMVDYDVAIRLDPNYALAHFNRGNSYQALGRHAEALADYDAAIRLDPNFALAYLNKGVVHTNRDEWVEALDAFEAAARYGDATGARYAALVRQKRRSPSEQAPTKTLQEAVDSFLAADSLDALGRAIDDHPILAQRDLLAALEQFIAEQTSAPQRPALRQRLEWLRQLTTPNPNP